MSKTLEWVTDRRSPIGDLGIELEVEGKRTATSYFAAWPHVRNWISKTDGSLRNGVEYITRSPVKCDEKLEGRIKLLVDALKDNVTDNSIRTSCHVHVNCLKLTPIQLMNGCFSFWLVEDILADYWGEERKGNQFCRRLSDGQNVSNIVDNITRTKFYGLDNGGRASCGLDRYMGLNPCAFAKHGSVEFRGMRGTVDTQVLYDWIRTTHHVMHTASKRYKTPLHIFENYLNTSNVVDFLKKITGPYISDKLTFDDANLDRVNDNAIKLAEFAYYMEEEGTSWDEWEKKLIEKREAVLNPPAVTTTETPAPAVEVINSLDFETVGWGSTSDSAGLGAQAYYNRLNRLIRG